MSKCDPQLGRRVHEHLVSLGVETPFSPHFMADGNRQDAIASHFRGIMVLLGLDMNDDSLVDTPNRVAKMYLHEVFAGLDYDNFPKATTVENKMGSEMVVEPGITVSSNCEHHFVVIDGVATVGYIPKDKVLGLSKLNRIVDFFARRPQVQERLTVQVYHALTLILGTDDVAVVVKATHHCVKSRGIRDTSSYTVTSKLGGAFLSNAATRSEFMALAYK